MGRDALPPRDPSNIVFESRSSGDRSSSTPSRPRRRVRRGSPKSSSPPGRAPAAFRPDGCRGVSGAAPAAGDGLDPFHTMMESGPDHLKRRGPTPGASGCPSLPRADRRRVRRVPDGRRRCKRAGSASWWIDARTKAFEAVARHLPHCRSRRITLRRHRERREEKPVQRLHRAASTGDKRRANTPAGMFN